MAVTIEETMRALAQYIPKNFAPKIAMILGSGLSPLAEQITNATSVPYQAIPGISASAVMGHASLLVFGYLQTIPVVCLRGRLHLYEGASPASIRTLIHIVKHLGCNTLLVTAAVGSLKTDMQPGDLLMVRDHINLQFQNPLVGPNDESVGPRFVDLTNAYDPGLRDIIKATANKLNIPIHEGVYLAALGPSFETPAEIRAFRQWGADVVGMSVVPEVILARHCGLQVASIAAITNLAAGLSQEILSHEHTLRFAEIAARKLTKLIPEFLKEWIHVAA